MAILGKLFSLFSRSRGYGRRPGYSSYGMGRARSRGLFGGSLGRMAMGGAAAWGARRLLNRRYR